MNNFNTLMAFIAAFNLAAIQRLKHTKSLLKRRTITVHGACRLQ